MKRLWRWLRQLDRVERLESQAERSEELLAVAESERDRVELECEGLRRMDKLLRSLMAVLRDVNAELDQRCIELEKVR